MSRRERPLTPAQLGSIVVALLAAIAVAVVVAIVVPPATREAAPDIPVKAYLRALVKGDVAGALKIGQVTPAAGDKLLTAAAYAKASDHITSFNITGTRASGGTATVTARVRQGGKTYDARFDAVRGNGFPGLAPWNLTPQQLPQLEITVTGPKSTDVMAAGVTLPTENNSVTQSVLPGTYALSATSSPYYSAPARSVTTMLGQPGSSVRFPLTLTSQGATLVQASARSWITKCAESGELAPSGCPFRAVATPGITYSNGRWTIVSLPALNVGAWNADAGGWQVTTSSPGSVAFTADAAEGNLRGTASTGPREFVVIGTAVPSASGVAFVPSASYSSESGSSLT